MIRTCTRCAAVYAPYGHPRHVCPACRVALGCPQSPCEGCPGGTGEVVCARPSATPLSARRPAPRPILGKRAAAAQFLRAFLAGGRRPAREVLTAAQAHGISTTTIERAKVMAGVRSVRMGSLGPRGRWQWVREETPTETPTAKPRPAKTVTERG